MAEQLEHTFQMRVSQQWLERIDEWRARQKPIPSRAEAIRRLVEAGLRDGAAEVNGSQEGPSLKEL